MIFSWLDSYLILLIILLPLFGMLYVFFIPVSDIYSVRKVSFTFFALELLLLGRAFTLFVNAHKLPSFSVLSFSFQLDYPHLLAAITSTLIILILFGFRLAYTELLGRQFILNTFLIFLFFIGAISSSSLIFQLICSHIIVWIFSYSLAVFGIKKKGSAIFKTVLIFSCLDFSAIIALIFQDNSFFPFLVSWSPFLLVLPALARLMIASAFPVSSMLLKACTLELDFLLLGIFIPLGASLLLNTAQPIVQLGVECALGFACLINCFRVFQEKRLLSVLLFSSTVYSALLGFAVFLPPYSPYYFSGLHGFYISLVSLALVLLVLRLNPIMFTDHTNTRTYWGLGLLSVALLTTFPYVGGGTFFWETLGGISSNMSYPVVLILFIFYFSLNNWSLWYHTRFIFEKAPLQNGQDPSLISEAQLIGLAFFLLIVGSWILRLWQPHLY